MGALFGLVVGSFLNVIVARLPNGQSLVTPRSRCPSCKHSIPFWANVPLLGYLILLGRCYHCKAKISLRYPLIEFLCALLFFTTERRFGMSSELILRDWPFVSLLIAITFIDLEHRIIPDPLSLGGLALGILTCFRATDPGWISCLLGAAFGFGIFFSLSWFYYHWKGVVGLGGGDIKLLAMIGSFVGLEGVFTTILVSSIFGSVVGVIYGLAQKGQSQPLLQVSIPYGPFLVIGALYHYLIGPVIWLPFMIPT